MFDAISAEALKLPRHKATWFLVWMYPIAFGLVVVAMVLVGMIDPDPPTKPNLSSWLGDVAGPWMVPTHALGRFLFAAYVAVVFAGEYGWNTWKLIVPHRSRHALIAAKYVLILFLFLIAFTLTALLSTLGIWLEDVVSGDIIPAGVTAGAILNAHGAGALSALAPALLTIAYAALAAVLTRSTVAALVVVIVAVTLEQLLFNGAVFLSTKAPGLIWPIYHVLPGYHLANLESWIRDGAALSTKFPTGGVVALAWSTSLAVAAAWIAVLVTLTFAAFKRQDLN